ncbi:TRIC cation channel family protein [Sessilibacter corallicola]|uniref:TRIC cation channel family protein n=1 Tax=Sessilibacter corallicola TaxID=2904075 RepID=A0ABQ0ADC4_9GAMM
MFLYFIDLFGTAVFAVSGVILASKLRMDPFGVIVLGSVTAVGGGTIRDIILDARPIFWINDTTYLWVILCTCVLAMLLVRHPKRIPWWVLPVCDAIGLSVFVGIGVDKALAYQDSAFIAIMMGVMTGCGGGVLRDVLAREIPLVLRHEIYATACIVGGIFHTTALSLGYNDQIAFISGAVCTLIIRLCAIRWHLSLPVFAMNK